MARSKSRNRAGAQLVVDRVVELKKRTSMPSVIAQAQGLQSQFASKFAQKYSLIIEGSREVSKDGHILTAKIYRDGKPQNYGEFMDGGNFSWKIEDGESKTGNSLYISSDDIDSSPTTITCTWKHNYTSTDNQTGVMGTGLAALTTNIQITWAEIVQYLWSTITDEDEIKQLPSDFWSDNKTDPANDNLYLWRRTSKDNGSTWTYFRESGLNGTNGWSSFNLTLYKRSETEPAAFDGGDLTYTFATNSLEGNLGTWSRDIPTDSTDPVWAIYALAFAQASSDEIPPTRWTSPARLSTEGTAGAKGDSVVTVFIFQQSETNPATPTGNVSYNLISGEISNISPWSKTVPTGSNRVWVSLATGVTNSDSIVILPARWSSPEIFREKGDTGKGIQSITTYYLVSAQNTGITMDADGWSTTPQATTNTLKYLWQYTETLWTDESKTYTDPIITGTHGEQGIQGEPGKDGENGEDGKDGADAPEVQIQYAWGMSNTVEPSPSIWLFDGKFFVWNGRFVGSTELWSYKRTKKPQDGNLWYEWIRWSTDGGKTWKKPQCITGDKGAPAITFSIEYSPEFYMMTSRDYVSKRQEILFSCTRTNTIVMPEWSIDSNDPNITLSIGDDGISATVVIGIGTISKSFSISCSLEGVGTKTVTVTGQPTGEPKPEYLSIVRHPEEMPGTLPDGSPLLAYDHLLYIDENQYEIPYYWTGSEWIMVTPNTSNYAQIMDHVLNDALTASGNISPSVGALYGYIGNLASKAALIEQLYAINLIVGNVTETDPEIGFRFRALAKDENGDPVVEAIYNDVVIFKMVPTTGRIFFGTPNEQSTAPLSGFMYDPTEGCLISKDRNIVIDTDGTITAEGAVLENADVSGKANITEGFFGGQIDCPSFSSLPRDDNEIEIECPTGAESQLNTIRNATRGELTENKTYECTHSAASNVKYISILFYDPMGHTYIYFYDSNRKEVGRIYNHTEWWNTKYESTWAGKAFTLNIKYGEGDVFIFKDLPTEPNGLKTGQVWVDNATLKIKG